ncbi:MAG TPA: alcohol dehydrogenase catalytic domain-containing protein [Candidatus Binatia bacterium]|nr:alcohol dehydrogenase catalytic domain-containing protein [Candidatus Binatia bacterium]
MRAAVLYDVDDIRIEERSIPELRGGDLLVRTAASGICSGDLMPWYIRRKAPLVFGHEPAGVVEAVGDPAPRDADGKAFAVGDRVFAHHHAPCMTCVECLRGNYVQCTAWRKSALEPGGMAEYFRVPAGNIADTLRLPERLDFVAGSLVEPLGCVVKSLRRSRVREGDVLYVVGLGIMGLLHVALARGSGLYIVASDFVAERRRLAEAMGATALDAAAAPLAQLHALTKGRGADAVICGPGSPAALQHAIDAAAPGGTVLMFTPLEPGTPFPLDQPEVYFRDLSLVASYSCGPDDTREALLALADGRVRPDEVGVHEVRLEGVAEAYRSMRDAKLVKPVVRF